MDRRMGWYLWPQSEEDAKRSHEEGQRRWTMDIGHQETEQVLRRTERELKRIYLQAQTEAQQKLEDHFRKYEIKDRIKREALRKGEITEAEYAYWRKGQICIGQRWRDMVDTLTQDYVNADKIAMSTIYGHIPEAYAINHNYATFQVEQGSHIDTSYTLYDRSTVERLVRDNPELLPKPRVDIPKDKRWNRAHIRDAITQGIVQGEDLRKVAHRLQKVTDMDYRAALRNARTSVTGAQNAGRVEAYHRAEKMGIELEQEWLATLDGRTRHSHRQMDGKRVKIGEKFDNGCMYPGDPSGPPEEVYNCRCTLVPVVKGIDQSDAPRNDKLGGMSYEEWKNEHQKFKTEVPTLQTQIGKSTDVDQINAIMNGQGWFRKNAAGIQSIANLTGCDLESAKSIAASYQRVFEKYPQLVGKLDAPNASPKGMGDDTYAWCYIRQNGRVQVNPNKYNNWSTVVAQYERDMRSGWHPYGTTAESIVTHEIGHGIDGLLAREGVLGGYTSSGEFRYASSSMKATIMKRAAKLDQSIAEDLDYDRTFKANLAVEHSVSGYAAKDPQEWFAECFAEYITSAKPRTVATEFGKELEKLLGRMK